MIDRLISAIVGVFCHVSLAYIEESVDSCFCVDFEYEHETLAPLQLMSFSNLTKLRWVLIDWVSLAHFLEVVSCRAPRRRPFLQHALKTNNVLS